MSYWDNSTYATASTSSTVDYVSVSVDDHLYIRKEKMSDWKFNSKPLEKISKIEGFEGNVALFAYRKSLAFKDKMGLEFKGMSTYLNDPVVLGYDAPTKLASYNFAIVIDALEYIQGKMTRANVIKEAMATLNPESYNPYVLVLTKTPEMVKELAKNSKYEKVDGGFLIPDNDKNFGGLVIQGLDADDLIDIAYFAGAKYIQEDILLETDLACIRIYLYKQG